MKQQLINAVTASAQNRRLPLWFVAEQVGIKISARALRRAFDSEGYHRRVSRVKPFLSSAARVKQNTWAEEFRDWSIQDWADVIWSNECAFSPGQVSGTVWVTRRPGEEYLEDCLVPKFAKQTTIMVWGSIYRNLKGPLVIWDMTTWGRINGPTYIDKIIHPHLNPWWTSLHQQDLSHSGYIYFQQDGAPAHRSMHAGAAFDELGMANYLLPWPPSSPDISPIEAVWRVIKRRITHRQPCPTTVPELPTIIQEEWDNFSPNEILDLTSSVSQRVQDLLTSHGGHTPW